MRISQRSQESSSILLCRELQSVPQNRSLQLSSLINQSQPLDEHWSTPLSTGSRTSICPHLLRLQHPSHGYGIDKPYYCVMLEITVASSPPFLESFDDFPIWKLSSRDTYAIRTHHTSQAALASVWWLLDADQALGHCLSFLLKVPRVHVDPSQKCSGDPILPQILSLYIPSDFSRG